MTLLSRTCRDSRVTFEYSTLARHLVDALQDLNGWPKAKAVRDAMNDIRELFPFVATDEVWTVTETTVNKNDRAYYWDFIKYDDEECCC